MPERPPPITSPARAKEPPNGPPGQTVTSGERAGEDDRALAVRASGGDAEAFAILYGCYMAAVYRYVFYQVRNEAEAGDVTSDVFMKAVWAIPREDETNETRYADHETKVRREVHGQR